MTLGKASGESKEGRRKESEYVNKETRNRNLYKKKRKGATIRRREIRKRKNVERQKKQQQ